MASLRLAHSESKALEMSFPAPQYKHLLCRGDMTQRHLGHLTTVRVALPSWTPSIRSITP